MSSISASRRGYNYQDKYALLLLLQCIRQGNLTEFEIDKPIDSTHSLDIYLVQNGMESIYEIKTGKVFKEDKHKKLGDELITLYKFNPNNNCNKFIIIDPEYTPEIQLNKGYIEAIQKSKTLRGKVLKRPLKEVATELRKSFGFDKLIPDLMDFKEFLGGVKLDFKDSNKKVGLHSPLEYSIHNELHELARSVERVNLHNANWALPIEAIMCELLEVIRLESASPGGFDLISQMGHKLLDIFQRVAYITKEDSPSEASLSEIKGIVENSFIESTHLNIISGKPPFNAIGENPEGQTIST